MKKYILCLLMAQLLAACSGSVDSKKNSGSGNDPNASSTTSTTGGTNPAQIMPGSIVAAVPAKSALGTGDVAGAAPGETLTIGGDVASPTSGTIAITGPSNSALDSAPPEQAITEKGAFRLLQQATFGPTEAGIQEARTKGSRRWLAEQLAMPVSTFGYRDRDAIHKWPDKNTGFCDQFAAGTVERDQCWRDWYSSDLIKLDFFKQASLGTDQLRQRIGFALSQILVVSEVEVSGTYGLSDYFQMLRDRSLGTYRDVLLSVAKHPVMGEYLNMVNNDASDPNENFARELLQLFAIGTCELNLDGTLKGGKCQATYDNAMVREYAFALTGWTFPVGGVNAWCTSNCGWKNPTYLKGAMVPVAAQHDTRLHNLLAGTSVPAGSTPSQALNAVVDSLMNHPNIAPHISKRLIQALVSSNPSPAYVGRVSAAFNAGKFETFGTGSKGDLSATVAAILLDTEARSDASADSASTGMLRDPVIMMVSAVRALNGYTDGERMGKYGWGSNLSQPVFNSPSVFNFYAPDYPLPGAPGLVAPQFQLANANTNLGWFNFANDLIYWWYSKGAGLLAKSDLLGSTGTKLSYAAFEADAENIPKLVDRLDRLLTGGALGTTGQAIVAKALAEYSARDTWLTDTNNQSSWQRERVKTAAYLILASPHFQIQK
jgi:uncharacterized protein (DUF1800 family)